MKVAHVEECPECSRRGRFWLRSVYIDGHTDCRFCRMDRSRERFARYAAPVIVVCVVLMAATFFALIHATQ